MRNNEALEEHIKRQFSDYNPEVPPHIWENIMAGKTRKRPGASWFNFFKKNLLLLLLLAILIGGVVLVLYTNISKPNEAGEAVMQTNTNASTDQKELSKHTLPGKSTPIDQGSALTGTGQTNPVNSNAPGNNNTQIDLLPSAPGQINNKPATGTHSDEDLAGNHTGNQKQDRPPGRSKHTKGRASMSYQQGNADTVELGLQLNPDALVSINNEMTMKRWVLENERLSSRKNITPGIKRINIPYLDIPCPESEKHIAGNKRYVEIYGGPDYAFRSITDTGNSAYVQKRKESSRFTSAFSAGLRYTRVFSNGMSFRTGFNYSQINEKFKYAQGNILQVVYITNSNGDTTGSFNTSGTRYKTTHNKYRTLDIPLLIGYELGNGKWHANFNAGAIVNLYSWQKGDVLDTAYQPVTITTGKASSPYQFKTNAGIGFLGSVSIYYKVSGRMHMLVEPYFRYNFSPASKSDLTLKQKYNSAGIRLGLRVDF